MRVGLLFLLSCMPLLAMSMCPMMMGNGGAHNKHSSSFSLPPGHPTVVPKAKPGYFEAVKNIDFKAVAKDIETLMHQSQAWWPADYGNYGPLFVRLAWHCSGSYRTSDGRGGCDGGRQRFDPERSWEDNTNLDKARKLLWPIKQKYGLGLSWGDLFILAGTTAIQSMGGPILGFCGGRIDDDNGFWSEDLGPTPQQEEDAPCPVNGQCKSPLGTTTIGLIYLNPEGPMGNPIPEQSAGEVRDTFARMAMNDTETVALIGGGHAFGKTHGACPKGPGPSPKEDPANPWPGDCGTGKGTDAFTSGIEGPWTADPTTWDNNYFKYLATLDFTVHQGPGGKWQWQVNGTSPQAPAADGKGSQNIMMMTSDISLMHDPQNSFQNIVQRFYQDSDYFDDQFKHAWYKLTTRDMGPVTRCVGDQVPPAQPFQYPLPDPLPPSELANFTAVAADLTALIHSSNPAFPADVYNGKPDYGPLFVRLAWACASTFRTTDYLGGCNGARLRYSPEKDWPINAQLDKTLSILEPIKTKYGNGLSWADLIVLAGYAGIEDAGGLSMPFCGGRTDADDGAASAYLEPRMQGDFTDNVELLKWTANLLGLTFKEMTVLMGGGHSLGQMHFNRTGFTGSWTSSPTKLNNEWFNNLISQNWKEYDNSGSTKRQFKAADQELYMLKADLLFSYDAELFNYVRDYASDNDMFLSDFAATWVKMMNIDRFDGPAGNLCQ